MNYSYIRLGEPCGCLTSTNVRLEWQGHSTVPAYRLRYTGNWVALEVIPGFELSTSCTGGSECTTTPLRQLFSLDIESMRVLYIVTSTPPLENEHVKNLDQPGENVIFHRTFVEQVKNARNSVFGDICLETCVSEYSDIRVTNLLAKRNATKENLV